MILVSESIKRDESLASNGPMGLQLNNVSCLEFTLGVSTGSPALAAPFRPLYSKRQVA